MRVELILFFTTVEIGQSNECKHLPLPSVAWVAFFSKAVNLMLFIHCLLLECCDRSLFCSVVLCLLSCFETNLLGKGELVA